MPIHKFRHVSEVPKPARSQRDAAELLEAAFASARLRHARIDVRGVQRFRSVEEAQKSRREHESRRAKVSKSQ